MTAIDLAEVLERRRVKDYLSVGEAFEDVLLDLMMSWDDADRPDDLSELAAFWAAV